VVGSSNLSGRANSTRLLTLAQLVLEARTRILALAMGDPRWDGGHTSATERHKTGLDPDAANRMPVREGLGEIAACRGYAAGTLP
jgi:hypothetical protein